MASQRMQWSRQLSTLVSWKRGCEVAELAENIMIFSEVKTRADYEEETSQDSLTRQ